MNLALLKEIKNRKGRRTFPKEEIEPLIKRGLIAGDHSRLYLTDLGDFALENPKAFEFLEELKGLK